MGYIRHHAIVVTGPSKGYPDGADIDVSLAEDIHSVRRKAFVIAKRYGLGDLVSPIIKSKMNAYGNFLVAPDGSKEGWDESKMADDMRQEIVALLESLRYGDGSTGFSYAEIQFGDDNGEAKLLARSDRRPEDADA